MAQAATELPGSDPADGDLRSILASILVIVLLFAAGLTLAIAAGGTYGISRAFFFLIDMPGFGVIVATLLALSVFAVLPRVSQGLNAIRLAALPVWSIALGTLLLSSVSVNSVYHGYAFSMDEWMTRLQAEIFLSGHLSATLPEEWREFGRAMYQPFASYDPGTGTLASNYRPGMSALYAVFDIIGLGRYTSAFLNALSVVLIARVTRQVFPRHAEAAVVAALMLATSQQALAASLTSYAMSAHLCLNLLWLTLFLENRLWTHLLAALVGVAAASLHQVHFHLFFALPFLLTLLRPFRPGLVALYGGTYLMGHLAVLSWDWWSFNRVVAAASPALAESAAALPAPQQAPGLLERVGSMARLPSVPDLASVAVNIVRMFAWQSLALVPLLVAARGHFRANRILVLLVWSLVVSTLPYPLLMPDQGHGWGYRYLHGLIGHLVLLAIPGWIALRSTAGSRPFLGWVMACLLVSPFILLPFRGYQIYTLTGPYASASALASEQDAEITIVDNFRIFIGSDIPRNSPVTITPPVVLNLHYLTPAQIRRLCATYKVAIPAPESYAELGLRLSDEIHPELSARYDGLQKAMSTCNR